MNPELTMLYPRKKYAVGTLICPSIVSGDAFSSSRAAGGAGVSAGTFVRTPASSPVAASCARASPVAITIPTAQHHTNPTTRRRTLIIGDLPLLDTTANA